MEDGANLDVALVDDASIWSFPFTEPLRVRTVRRVEIVQGNENIWIRVKLGWYDLDNKELRPIEVIRADSDLEKPIRFLQLADALVQGLFMDSLDVLGGDQTNKKSK